MINVALGDLVEILPSVSTSTFGDVPVQTVTSGCLEPAGWNARGIRPNLMTANAASRSVVRAGEVLVARSNTEELVGRAALYPGSPSQVHATDLVFRIRCGTSINAAFLGLYLAALQASGYWKLRSSGSSSTMKKITRAQLASVTIFAPAIDAQLAIVVRLSSQLATADRALLAALARRRAVDALQQRFSHDAFQGIIPLAVNSGEPSPRGWGWNLLTDLARLESGHTPSRSRPHWWGGDVSWIALPDIRALDGRVAFETAETTNPEGIAHSSARMLPTGTVVMSRTASVGFVTRMGRPMATSQDFVNWVCGPRLDPEFLMHLLLRCRDFVRSVSSGAVHKTVYMPTVKAFRVCIPSLDEQRRIVAQLQKQQGAAEGMAAAIDAERKAIDALPVALLRRAFALVPERALA